MYICIFVAKIHVPYRVVKQPQRVAVCCSVLQCVAVCCSVLQCGEADSLPLFGKKIIFFSRHRVQSDIDICTYLIIYIYRVAKQAQRVAVRCSVLQCVAVWYRVAKQTQCSYVAGLFQQKNPFRYENMCIIDYIFIHRVAKQTQRVAVCCSVLQCVAVCLSVL